jgi:hypothetical protein
MIDAYVEGRHIHLFSSSFTRLASVYLGGCFLNFSVLVILDICNVSHFSNFGNKIVSEVSSSSVHSEYTFKKPSKVITSHSAMNLLFAQEISIVTIVFSTLAGAICDAIVLFQIKS